LMKFWSDNTTSTIELFGILYNTIQ
jgi:hypothetical protein